MLVNIYITIITIKLRKMFHNTFSSNYITLIDVVKEKKSFELLLHHLV
jgi:hypothetical protein